MGFLAVVREEVVLARLRTMKVAMELLEEVGDEVLK